ncbi:hypothetical protein TREMEDRAFT_39997 [Tremella mesenterica DSM 1558]|uniref:uncharacterized protein n=1 Tax=Tremella mesenterica (strain ATCC 24925 / CBS 8224 / DSM 1558 / NBRC 9311 / NRRL Y-6157 / RJB 2259-6 / UBC 559-6) TaxID=578456 RepID=UPI0003F49784|nr:uncharacterized protein TREMEDRAFT_39997 [Tremella mesenterica DSM 1558]EIW67855.1 hypothetical protein TREMEDRAFT_39997 [Tremella mesenterica DSM 1558]
MGMGHTGQVDSRRAKRKNPDWDGDDLQMMSLQVDLGSSDLWVASDLCTSSDCASAPALFNTSLSLDSGQSVNWTYESGAVSGEIFWEEMALGNFTIGYQAFVAAQTVTQEDLSGGAFSGVLGLALPANSFILKQIPGTTGSSADGATFLDNLFGLGSAAPTERLFSLSLERREDVRTSSFLGIGTTFDTYCPKPCSPPSSPIVAQPQLGVTGYTHWRIQLQSITATTWSDPQHGLGGQVTTVTLGASQVDTSKSTPLAVLDSGGVQILVGYKPFADSIYSIYGIQASSDGIYRLPCTQQLALTFTFAETEYSVHPLDMSWADSADPSQQTCIGAIQYSSTLGSTGDFILGSSFLKNVYSIFQYPDTMRTTVWQPSVGLVSLTNASLASQEFYAVRSLHQSLSSISANHQTTSPSSPLSPSSSPGSSSSHSASKAVVPAVVSVLGFFLVAAGLFCAWWFWLRHKWGAGGVVQYKQAPNRHRGDLSISSLRSKKHNAAQRQKSMVEGLSDYEDSWASGTGTEGESIRLGYLPETVATDVIAGHRDSAGSSVRINNGVEGDDSLIDLNESDPNSTSIGNQATVINTRRTSANRTISFHDADPDVPSPPVINPYSQPGYTSKQTGPFPEINPRRSMNMSGPFPSPAVRGQSGSVRPDSSPMYDIRSSDYFEVPRGRTRSSVTGGSGGNRGNSQQGREGSRGRSASGGRRLSPGKQIGSVLGQVLVEEPEAG